MRRFCVLLLGLATVVTPTLAEEATDKPVLVLEPGGHTLAVRQVLFTRDGKEAISVSADNTVRFWDVATGELLRVLRLPIGPQEQEDFHGLALSPDGRFLAVSGQPPAADQHWVYLVALANNKVVRIFKGHKKVITSVAYSPNGQWLAASSDDLTIRLWEAATGQTKHVLSGHEKRIRSIAFSPDSSRLAGASQDTTVRLWSVVTGKSVAEPQMHPRGVQDVAWSPDGKSLASCVTAPNTNTLHWWTLDGSLRQSWNVAGHPFCITFTADGRSLLVGRGAPHGCFLFDLASGKEKPAFTQHINGVRCVRLSSDGQLAISGGMDGTDLYLWKTADGRVVHHLGNTDRSIAEVSWSPNGASLAWKNAATEQPSALRAGRSFLPSELRFGTAPRANYQYTRSTLGALSLDKSRAKVTVKNGKKTMSVLPREGANSGPMICFTFLDRDRIVLARQYGLYLHDTSSGKLLRIFTGVTQVQAIAPARSNRYFLTASADRTLRVWDPNRETPLLSLFVSGNDWIAWTSEGYYAASPGGERLMGWQVNNGPEQLASFYPAAQFRRSLYRPDVIRRVLDEGSVAKALAAAGDKSPVLDIDKVLPPKVAIMAPAQSGLIVKESSMTVKAVAQSVGPDPVSEMQLRLDGRPHEGEKNRSRSARPQPGKVEAAWTVQLPPGTHRLSVAARTAKSYAISDPIEISYLPAQPPDLRESLHILAIGIDAYPGDLRLQCAVRDATKLKEALEKNSASLFRPGQRRLLTNTPATKQAILAELDDLKRQMKAQDVAVIFYAGHGHKDDHGEFYLLPPTFDADRLAQTAVTGSELKKKLAELPGRVILMLDACHSGAVGARVKGSQAFTDDLTRELADDDCGVIVMCAAMGQEESLEDGEHGYFTRFLVGGLSGQADRYKGRVYFTGLDYYVERMVTEKTQDRQHPVTAKPSTIRSFALTQP